MSKIIPVPHTEYCLYEITLVQEGETLEGNLVLRQRSHIRHNMHWFAKKDSDEAWQISGEGAIRHGSGERVTNVDGYPFCMDPLANEGIKTILRKWLQDHVFPR